MAIYCLEDFLQSFFHENKKFLLDHYPGLNLHRLRNDIALYASLNGVDSEELFDLPYIAYATNPLTLFFEKLKQGIPLEYITKHAYFYRAFFKVTSDVLIPRSETEILVELASIEIKKKYFKKNCRIVDIGTGSGAIALSLMMEDLAQLEVVACDISEKALSIARENYFNLGFLIPTKQKINFIKSDRLQYVPGTFDLILSNPPYIKNHDSGVHHQVQKFEPALALYLNDDIYDQWYDDFFTSIYQKLAEEGISLIEGHELHLDTLKDIALKVGFKKVEIIKDYTDRKRFLRLKKNI